MPRAADIPYWRQFFDDSSYQMNPSARNARVKRCHGATPAIVNAVIDALGVKEIDMPLTPERVWRALHALPDRT